ncbi:hypothetical protein Pelo_15534 [Pelomyxa schiedti]|nr:hypothetical protein Pelo_15534 [Pelomyxa schiedti]
MDDSGQMDRSTDIKGQWVFFSFSLVTLTTEEEAQLLELETKFCVSFTSAPSLTEATHRHQQQVQGNQSGNVIRFPRGGNCYQNIDLALRQVALVPDLILFCSFQQLSALTGMFLYPPEITSTPQRHPTFTTIPSSHLQITATTGAHKHVPPITNTHQHFPEIGGPHIYPMGSALLVLYWLSFEEEQVLDKHKTNYYSQENDRYYINPFGYPLDIPTITGSNTYIPATTGNQQHIPAITGSYIHIPASNSQRSSVHSSNDWHSSSPKRRRLEIPIAPKF